MNTSETTTNLFKAMIEAAPEVKAIAKSKQAFEYKYATLDSLIDMLRTVLPKHGLWFIQTATNASNDALLLSTRVIHTSGEYIEESIYFDKTDLTKGKPNDTQKIGAAITYFRRYSLAAIFAIASDEDVDGDIESMKPQPKQPPKQTAKKQSALDYIQTDTNERLQSGETYDSIIKWYAELLKTDAVKDVASMSADEQRNLANAIYTYKKGNRNGK